MLTVPENYGIVPVAEKIPATVLHANRVAADDNPMRLMSLTVKPLAAPPFPLDRLERAAE